MIHFHRYSKWNQVNQGKVETDFGYYWQRVYVAHCDVCGKPKSKRVKLS